MLADTFPAMLHRAAWRRPDATFLRWSDRGRAMTFAEVDAASDRAAGALAALGVGRGDRVGLLAHNGLDYVVAMFGAWKLGAITAHIAVQVADDLAAYVQDCTPSVLVYTHDLHPALERDRPAMPSLRHTVCMDGPQPGSLGWGDLLADATPWSGAGPAADDPAHLSYTSGSTGRPKGAVLRHGHTARAAAAIAERLGLSAADASMGATSPASSYGLVANLLPGVHVGMTVGLRSRWDLGAVFDDMVGHGVTYFPANPVLLDEVLRESRRRSGPPPALRLVASGGAAVPPALKRAWFDELHIPFCESYGQSELGGFLALGRPARPDDARLGAVGPTLPDRPVVVLDDDGHEVPPGRPGELCVGGGVMWGYWGMPERTAQTVRDGWLHTGDVGTVDADGFLTTLGRLSERILHDGEALFPRPYEEALLADERVLMAAVIAVPDREHGQVPLAAVTLAAPATAGELRDAFLARGGDARLGPIEVIEAMPMTATGKMDKITLRARFGADARTRHRERIWAAMRDLALPDSRFHYDFSSFIADFPGSDACAERVRSLDAYLRSELIFITPDNSTEVLRRVAMADGKPFLMTTYGIRRGFLLLDPAGVPPEERSYAATLDGMDRYARPVSMADLAAGPKVGLLVTGGSAVSTGGVRFGKGHGYFDLEWALLCEIDACTADAEIVDVVHDCQVVDDVLPGDDHDVPVDWIVTPTRTLHVDVERTWGRVRWELLPGTELDTIPPIVELRALRRG